jgi:hypothetical protein
MDTYGIHKVDSIEIIEELIDVALVHKPLDKLSAIYGRYYSPYYSLMYLMARYICSNDMTVLELGVEKGRGVASFAAGRPSLDVCGFDSYVRPELASVLAAYPNIRFENRPSMPAESIGNAIDILHIDTEHSYSMAKAEFESWEPYLSDKAIVLFDDLHAMNGAVLQYFISLPWPKIQDDRLHPVCGYGILLYGRDV